MENVSIDKIVLKCQRNDGQAQRELYLKFSAVLFSICKRYAANDDDAKDYFQEGFISIFQNIQQFKFQGSFEGWMKRIMINTCLEKLRKNQPLEVEISDKDIGDWDDEVLDDEVSELPYDDLLQLIQNLPNQYRKVFNLYVFEELKHQQIAELLNISINTSKSNLARARNLLKEKIEALKLLSNEKNR